MTRQARIIQAGSEWFHVYNRGARHVNIFWDDNDRAWFLTILAKNIGKYPVQLHVFALMDNHYHFLLKGDLMHVSQFMRGFMGCYVRKFNYLHDLDGPLFRSRFSSVPIKSEAQLLVVTRYIHRNVLDIFDNREGLMYLWSSYRYYMDPSSCPNFLVVDEILKAYGEERKVAITRFSDFIGDSHQR